MSKGVYTLSNKVKSFWLPSIIKELKLENPFKKKLVCEFELLLRDLPLVDDADANDKLAIVSIVRLRKNPVEEVGSQTIEIKEELPHFVATGDFFSQISRRTVKGMGEIQSGICNCLAMSLPDISFQHSPLPDTIWDTFKTALMVTK